MSTFIIAFIIQYLIYTIGMVVFCYVRQKPLSEKAHKHQLLITGIAIALLIAII